MVAQRLMLLIQSTLNSGLQIDALTSLFHLLDSASVQAAVLANTGFLKQLASLLRNDAEPALQLLAASGIAVCVNGSTRALQPFLDAAGPLVLAEAADKVLTGAEHGQVALMTSDAFQRLIDLLTSLDTPQRNGAPTGPTAVPADFDLMADAVRERQIFSRYESRIASLAFAPSAGHAGGNRGGSGQPTEPIRSVRGPVRAAPRLWRTPDPDDWARLPDRPDVGLPPPPRDSEPARAEKKGRSESEPCACPFGWSFRGALVPEVVKRSPRPPERGGGATRQGHVPCSPCAVRLWRNLNTRLGRSPQ